MIRKGRELLARLITAMASLAMRIMGQYRRTTKRRAEKARGTVIERESLASGPLNLPKYPVELYWERRVMSEKPKIDCCVNSSNR